MSQPIFKKIGDILWIHSQGRTFTFSLKEEQIQNRQGRTAANQSAGSGTLKSPMPGRILKVLVLNGDKVSTGQTVVIIEAMKMEYALKAPFDGVVESVHKKSGDAVLLEEKVLVIKKGSAE